MTLATLRARAARHSGLPLATSVLVLALDARMNSNTVVVTLPPASSSSGRGAPGVRQSGDAPARRFAEWLDWGAPGLAEAAVACDWEGHFAGEVRVGPAPRLAPLDASAFAAALDWLLTESVSFYRIEIVDAASIRDEFLRAELPGPEAAWRYFDVDVSALDTRLEYFDHFGNDCCLAWTNGTTMRALFTNGAA